MNAIDMHPVFSVNCLDRMDHLRDEIFSKCNPATDKYLLLSQGNVLLNKNQDCFISGAELPEKLLKQALCVFLGGYQDAHYFMLSVTPEQVKNYESISLREFVIEKALSDGEFGIIAEANSLLNWHNSHAFCARCGARSVVTYGGWRRDCPRCETKHFPRTDPVVIMLVTHGEQCLVGRGYHFPENQFSCLAGFMEPGETFEQAALRELSEEAGVKGANVRYLFNQPWPFPSNLMIGVHIDAQDTKLSIDFDELEGAMWVSKSDVAAVLAGATDKPFLLPSKVAIARNLLEYWVND